MNTTNNTFIFIHLSGSVVLTKHFVNIEPVSASLAFALSNFTIFIFNILLVFCTLSRSPTLFSTSFRFEFILNFFFFFFFVISHIRKIQFRLVLTIGSRFNIRSLIVCPQNGLATIYKSNIEFMHEYNAFESGYHKVYDGISFPYIFRFLFNRKSQKPLFIRDYSHRSFLFNIFFAATFSRIFLFSRNCITHSSRLHFWLPDETSECAAIGVYTI